MLSQVFEGTVQLGTSFDRESLSSLASHAAMGESAQLVYVYSLGPIEPPISYPRCLGKVVYIGETKRITGAGKRFGHHIASATHKLSTNINHTLSVYYELGRQLRLRVFAVTDGRSTKAAEEDLLRAHLHKFGAYPLGQGSTGRRNTPHEVARLYQEARDIHEECDKILCNALY